MRLPEKLTEEFIKFVLARIGKTGIRHKNYKQNVDYYNKMAVHIEGKLPYDILNRKRPNEDEEVKNYRLDSWEPVTLASSNRAISIMRRALNPKVYALNFKERPAKIPEDMDLAKYLVEDFPKYRSLMNFIRKTYLPSDIADPNAVMLTEPRSYDVAQNEFFQPMVNIYPSADVLDYESDQWYLLQEDDEEQIYKVITTEYILHLQRTKDGFTTLVDYDHGFGFCPCHFTGGIIKGKREPYYNHSFMDGVLPHWNKVVSLVSEEDAGIITCLFPESWEIDFVDSGGDIDDTLRKLEENSDENMLIKTPQALLRYSQKLNEEAGSSMKTIKINRDALNADERLPTPPKDFIKKPIDVLEYMSKKVEQEEARGFKAINMDVINQIGADQSGVAKQMDRTELDNYLLMISEHIFDDVLPNLILHISAWLYGETLDEKSLSKYLPDITKPQSFDVLTLDFLTEEFKTSDNLPSSYRQELAAEIVEKRFNTDETKKKRLKVAIDLDPLYGENMEALNSGYAMGVISREDMYLHLYIKDLINELVEEDKNFLELSYIEKKLKLHEKVKVKIKDMEPKLIDSPYPALDES